MHLESLWNAWQVSDFSASQIKEFYMWEVAHPWSERDMPKATQWGQGHIIATVVPKIIHIAKLGSTWETL